MNNTVISRRGFFAVPALAPAILKAQTPAGQLRVAFVGIGTRGSYLLRQMVQVRTARVVAVCDILPERAQAAAKVVSDAGGSARVWTDFRKMLDDQKDIDAVVQATFDWTHKDINIAILEMGKHLYAEKPLALTADDCKAVAREAARAKGILQVGFQLRHDPGRNHSCPKQVSTAVVLDRGSTPAAWPQRLEAASASPQTASLTVA